MRSFSRTWQATLMALALAGVTSCGPDIRVKSSYDPRGDFAHYDTFAMLQPNKAVQTGPYVDPFLSQRLRQLTFESLTSRGFRQVPRKEAELWVGVQSATRGRVDVYPRTYGYGYYGPGWAYPTWGYDVHEYDEGIIVIDLIDPRTKAVVWRGTGVRTVSGQTTNEEMRAVIDEILNQYPPGSGQEDGE